MFVGRVYKIWAPGCEKVYVGSTTKTLARRLAAHKHMMTCWRNGVAGVGYRFSFEILAYEEAQIELIHEDEFENVQELHEYEKQWILKLNTVNTKLPITTQEERKQTKDCYMKTYRVSHDEHIKVWQRIKKKCPHCDKAVTASNLRRHIKDQHL